MTLTLRAVSLNDHPLTQPITAYFDSEGGSVGRGDHNTLALPDPERHISRQHAEISLSGATYRIKNVGSANPIIVRGQTLGRGESAPLAHRDQVRIGGYLLEVIQEDTPDDAADTVVRGRAAVDAATPGVVRSAAVNPSLPGDLGTPLSRDNPFADLLADPPPAAGVPASSGAWATPPVRPSHALLPDDFDPFAAPAPAPAAERNEQAPAAGPFGDLIPSGESASIDQLFGLRSGERDPLADFLADVSPPRTAAGAPAVSTDPLAMFGSEPLAPTAPAMADDVPDLRANFVPPRAAGLAAPVRDPIPPAQEGTTQALWAAFCEGADVGVDARQQLTPETMRGVGALLRAAVGGTLQLMSVRATAKHELRAEVTVIQARNNNPLKFSPDARSALEQMLQPPLRGFLPGPAAMTDAMHDLVGHTIGTMAGTRAALEGVLDRFTPQQLEAKLSGKSVLDSVLPMNRKAKLWELYLQHFEAIRNEAQDDFHSLFGRAFLAAYEQQLDRLKHDEPRKA